MMNFVKAITQVKDTMSRLSESKNELIEFEKERPRQRRSEKERTVEERENQMYEISILAIDTNTIEPPLARRSITNPSKPAF